MTISHKTTNSYQNFNVAIYATVYDVQRMADLDWLEASFAVISRHLKVGKVYLETHRDAVIAEETTIRQAQQFFAARGVQTAGGITYTVNERNRFQTYCYTDPAHRQKVRDIAEYTARLFDAFILDDFFFTNCKCEQCIAAKGGRSWTEYRLALMTEAAQNLIIGPAKAANPGVKVTIKYPNWYEHFQGLGFNLETEPSLFDAIYTGTETRDPVRSNQHLQAYHGYAIVRYFENLKPGGNDGGWVDPFGSRTLDRYAEQLWLTLFAKAPEVTLFNYSQVLFPVRPAHRAPWHSRETGGSGNTFDFDALVALVETDDDAINPAELLPPQFGIFARRRRAAEKTEDNPLPPGMIFAAAAGQAFAQIDEVIGQLGTPLGVPSYRPHHATGEDFLHSYLGMLGIPIDLRPDFPTGAPVMLLTESAKADPGIVAKIEQQLVDGTSVVVTSGLFKALQDRGIRDIVELTVTDRKASVQDFLIGRFGVHHAESPLLIPHIDYLTNDSWEEISGLTNTTGHPVLHSATYANGTLYVLTIPDNVDDLYKLPPEVLARIREVLLHDLPVRVDAPAQVMLFLYDNNTFIVESILPEPVDVRIITGSDVATLRDVRTGAVLDNGEEVLDWRRQPTGKRGFAITLKPHAYRAFKLA